MFECLLHLLSSQSRLYFTKLSINYIFCSEVILLITSTQLSFYSKLIAQCYYSFYFKVKDNITSLHIYALSCNTWAILDRNICFEAGNTASGSLLVHSKKLVLNITSVARSLVAILLS